MSYVVLARRYRSGTFDEVIGQDHVAQTLKRSITSGRIAHAFLFTGTRGVGKTSMARILAKSLNCLASDAPTVTPCQKCDACGGIARGEDIDVIEIDAASHTGVDNVREIIENARYRPARSRYKLYIIDEVHMLSRSAFNALLKIMEEPPEHVKFVLATTEVEKLPPTILSRCQRYDFRNIPSREVFAHLKRVVEQENVRADDAALLLVARAGAGSMRDSLSLLDRLLSVGETSLTTDLIERLLALPRAELIQRIAAAILQGDVRQTLTQADAVISGGLSVDTLVAALVDYFHNLLLIKSCGGDSQLVDLVGLDEQQVAEQAGASDAAVLTQNVTILEELRRQLRTSMATRALLDATLARLAMSEQMSGLLELAARLDGSGVPRGATSSSATRSGPPVQRRTLEAAPRVEVPPMAASPIQATAASNVDPAAASPAVPRPPPTPALPALPALPTVAVDLGDFAAVRTAMLERLAVGHGALLPWLEGARLVRIDDQTACLHFPAGQTEHGRFAADRRDKIADALAEVIGRRLRIEIDVDDSPPADPIPLHAERPAPLRSNIAREVLRQVEQSPQGAPVRLSDDPAVKDHPLVKSIVNAFDARIVD